MLSLQSGIRSEHGSIENIAPMAAAWEPFLHAFRSVFPDGEVSISTAHAIAPPDLGGNQKRAVVIAANKGMGKSKAIRAALGAVPPTRTILNVTFRRSLARGAAADLPGGGATYLDEEPGARFEPSSHPRLTILINSLWRVRGRYDIVIVDELVSVVEMLGSEIIDPSARIDICRALCALMQNATVVVLADALLDAPSLRIARCAGGLGRASLLLYTHSNHADHTYLRYERFQPWRHALEVALRARRKVVIPCMTRAFATRLREDIMGAHPGLDVLTYVADGEHDMEDHMRRIDDAWRVDVLIYSPVITAGCSFERRHFDECFLYAFQGTCTPRSAIQMSFRVRALRMKRIHVFVERGTPHTISDVALPAPEPAWRRADRAMTVHDMALQARAVGDVDRTRAFITAFWSLVRMTGVRVRERAAASPDLPPVSVGPSWVWPQVRVCADDGGPARRTIVLRSPSALGYGPFGAGATLRPHHLKEYKLCDASAPWRSVTLWGNEVGGGDRSLVVPRWVGRDNRNIWHQTVVLLWARALARASPRRVVLPPCAEDESCPDGACDEATLWASPEDVPWWDAGVVEAAHRAAHRDCRIFSRPIPLTPKQRDDVVSFVRITARRWEVVTRAWGGDASWFLHPLRAVKLDGLAPAHKPHAAIVRADGLTTILWTSAMPRVHLYDIFSVAAVLELGAAAWTIMRGFGRVVNRLAIAPVGLSTMVQRDVFLRARALTATLIRERTFMVKRVLVCAVWRDGEGGIAWQTWDGRAARKHASLANACRCLRSAELIVTCGFGSDVRRLAPSARVVDLALHVAHVSEDDVAPADVRLEDVAATDGTREAAIAARFPAAPRIVVLYAALLDDSCALWMRRRRCGEQRVEVVPCDEILDVDDIASACREVQR